MNKMLDRVMDGARTPEGKVIAVLLVISLALMAWNITALREAFAQNDEEQQAAQSAETVADTQSDQTDAAQNGGAAAEGDNGENGSAATEEAETQGAVEAEPSGEAGEPAAETDVTEPDASTASEPAGEQGEEAAPAEGGTEQGGQQSESKSAESPAAEPAGEPEGEGQTPEPAEGKSEASAEASSASASAEAAQTEPSEEAADKVDEENFPAVMLTATAGSTRVRVSAPAGALPKGVQLVVSDVTSQSVADTVSAATGSEVIEYQAIDVVLLDAQGNEIQPNESVTVSFTGTNIGADDVEIYHISDAGAVEEVAPIVASSDVQIFEAKGFSIYVVARTGEASGSEESSISAARATYEFFDADGTKVASYVVKEGDVISEPATSASYGSGVTWSDESGNPFSFNGGVYVVGAVTEGETHAITASYTALKNVIFYQDSAGTNIAYVKQGRPGDSVSTSDISVSSSNVDEAFVGWTDQRHGDEVIAADSVTVGEEDIELFPVFSAGNWIYFHAAEQGRGAQYVAPLFVRTGQSVPEVSASSMTGYVFEGWYTAFDGGTKVFNADGTVASSSYATLDSDLNVYGHWSEGGANYRVVYWRQVATDEANLPDSQKKYVYDRMDDSRTAQVGAQVSPSAADKNAAGTGFVYNAAKTTASATVAPDGSTVLNVYFDRQAYTLTFASSVYAQTSKASNGVYGYVTNIGYVQLYQSWGSWYFSYNGSSYSYRSYGNGKYYTRSTSTVATITALYQHSISGQFPIVDSDGTVYTGAFWQPNDSATYSYGLVAIDIMPAEDILFTTESRPSVTTSKTMNYYVETLPGQQGTTTYNGENYQLYTTIGANYNFVTEDEDFFDLTGFTQYDSDPKFDDNGIALREGDTINFYYKRAEYQVDLVDSLDGSNLGSETVKYGANIPEPAAPRVKHAGKVFMGWYTDAACTMKFDPENATMPDSNIALYAGWDDEWFIVTIDPNGGELQSGQSTWYWRQYGSLATEYADISRNYVYVGEGNGSYNYEVARDYADGDAPRTAKYVEAEGGAYEYQPGAYTLVGWYEVAEDGSLKPFNFNTEITHTTTLQARWGNLSSVSVAYSLGEGAPGAVAPVDPHTYTDQASAVAMDAPTAVPDGKVFAGWSVGGKTYKPGSLFIVDSEFAQDGVLTLTATYVDESEAGSGEAAGETTVITYHANYKDAAGNAVQTTIVKEGLVVNQETDALLADAFQRPSYALVGWALTPTGTVAVQLGQRIFADNDGSFNDLYAVWEPSYEGSVALDNWTYGDAPKTPTWDVVPKDAANDYADPEITYSADGENYTAEVPTEAGTYTVKAVWAQTENCKAISATAQFSIFPKEVSVRALDASKKYGEPDPAKFEYACEGLLGDDTIEVTVSREAGEAVGEYAITPSGSAEQGNYLLVFEPGVFSIGKADAASMNLQVVGFDGVYDGAEHMAAATVSDAQGTVVEYSTDGGETWSEEAPSLVDVGELAFLVRASNDSYEATQVGGTLKVAPAPLKIAAVNNGKVYEAEDPELTTVVTGLVAGESSDLISFDIAREDGEAVGEYDIVVTADALQGNYAVTTENGTFTISRSEAMSLTAVDYEGEYDAASHEATVTVEVPDGSEAKVEYSVDEGKTWTTQVPSLTNVGTTTFSVRASNPNYATVTDTEVTITITKAPLTVTAIDQTGFVYNGSAQGEAGTTYSGEDLAGKVVVAGGMLKGSDTLTSATLIGSRVGAGEYPGAIEVSSVKIGNATDNYDITMVPGKLAIGKSSSLAVEFAGYEGVYDGQEHTATAQASVPFGTAIEYSVDGAAWSVDEPSIRNAGTKQVQVRATNPNYEVATASAELNVHPAEVTVTANSASKVYGSPDPEAFTAQVSGLLEGEPASQIAYTVGRAAGENVGSYRIAATGAAVQGNYAVTYVPATFTIEKSTALDLAVQGYEGVYDGAAHAAVATPTVVAGTTVEYSTDNGETWSGEAPRITDAGQVAFLVRATNPNYEGVQAAGVLSVDRKAATVSAHDASKVYGDADPEEFTAQVTGVIGDDTLEFAVSRAEGEQVGAYKIAATGETVQGNYNVTYREGTFTITRSAALGITAQGYEGIYDGAAHAAVATPTITDGTTVEYSTDGGVTWSEDAPSLTNAGTLAFEVRATNAGYETATASSTITIYPAKVTVSAENAGKVYGEADPALTATVGGLVNNEPESLISYTVSRQAGENVGAYAIGFEGQERNQGNYEVAFEGATFTIDKAPASSLGLTVEGYEGTYDALGHAAASATVSVPEGTTVEYSLDGVMWSKSAPEVRNAGSHAVFVKATNPNYEQADAQVYCAIAPAPLTVAVNDQTGYTYDGSAHGESGATYTEPGDIAAKVMVSGLKGSDALTRVTLDGEETEAGSYEAAIVIAGIEVGNATDNYEIELVEGNLMIAKASSLSIQVAGYEGVYDGKSHAVSAVPTIGAGTVVEYSTDGGTTWSEDAPSIVNVGEQAVSVRATNPNYVTAAETATLKVSPKQVTVTALNAGKVYGEDEPELTAVVTGLVEGEATDVIAYAVTRNAGENVGDYEITASGEALQGNYEVVYENASFAISRSAQMQLTAASFEGEYDAQSHSATVVAQVPDGTKAVVEYSIDGGTTWTKTAPSLANAGTLEFSVRATNANYDDVVIDDVHVTIAKAPLELTARDQLDFRYNGASQGETGAVYYAADIASKVIVTSGALKGNDALTSVALNGSQVNAGSYPDTIRITGFAIGDATDNYEVTVNPGSLAIAKASTLSLHVTGYEGVYDGEVHAASAAPSVGPGTAVEFSVNGGETWTAQAPAIKDVGNRTVIARAINANYEEVRTSAMLKVTPRGVSVSAVDAEKVYGTDDPVVFSANVAGPLEGEANLIGYSVARAAGENAGTYAIWPSGAQRQGNYEVDYASGIFTITKATGLAVQASDYDATYDGLSHELVATATPVAGTVIEYSLDGENWSRTAPSIKNAGEQSVMLRAINPNYEDASAQAVMRVAPAAATVRALNANKVYGTAEDPAFMVEVTGMVNGEKAENVIAYAVGREAGEDVGEYTIAPTGNAEQGNYVVEFVSGLLSITASPQMSLTAAGYEGVYDAQPHGLSALNVIVPDGTNATVEYSVDGGDWTSEAPSITDVGTAKVLVRATNANYEERTQEVTLQVAPKHVTVKAGSFAKTYGQADPEFAAEVEGTLGSDEVEYALEREAGEDAGVYAVGFAEPVAEQGNYKVEFVAGSLEIGKAPITLEVQGYEGVYDGASHGAEVTASVAELAVDVPEAETVIEYSVDGGGTWSVIAPEIKDAGTFEVQVRAQKGANYEPATAMAKMSVAPRTVTLESESASQKYAGAGSVLERPDVTVGGDGFVEGEVGAVRAIGSLTLIGSIANEITFTKGPAYRDDNYLITMVPGTLEITDGTEEDPLAGDTGIVTKSHNGVTYGVGEEIEFVISVTNPYTTVQDAYLSEDLFRAELDDTVFEAMQPGETRTTIARYVATEDDAAVGSIENSVTVQFSEGKTFSASDPDPVLVTPTAPVEGRLAIEKALVNSDNVFVVGDTIEYLITVSNEGAGTLYDVTVVDELQGASGAIEFGEVPEGAIADDEGVTITALGPGETTSIPVRYVIVEDDMAKPLVNVAYAKAVSDDGVADEAQAIAPVALVEGFHTLTIHYVFDDGSEAAPDYVGSFRAGEEFSIESPQIEGYTPEADYVASDEGGMPAREVELSIVYAADEIIVPVDPVDFDGGDVEGDTPASAPAGAVAGTTVTAAGAVTTVVPAQTVATVAQVSVDSDGNTRVEIIEGTETALAAAEVAESTAPAPVATWSVFDLIATILTAAIAIVLLVGIAARRKEDEEAEESSEEQADSPEEQADSPEEEAESENDSNKPLRIASVVVGVIAIVALILTQNFTASPALFDQWSILFAIILIAQVVILVLAVRKRDNDDDESEESELVDPAPAFEQVEPLQVG